MSQNEMIMDYLERHGSITQTEAMNALGCFRLGARIWELKRRGVRIKRCMEDGLNRFGVRTRYARYYREADGGTASDTL